jgi:GNAT superfamily N-acetyltransferase
MNIREIASEDLEAVVYLFEQLGYVTRHDQIQKQLSELHQSGAGQAFVAEDGGMIIGVAIVHLLRPLHVDAPWALLSALIVDEKHRSSGVGVRLLTAAEGFAMEHGCSQLELSSSSARTRAHMFYERNGYQEKRLRFVKAFQ